MAKPKKTKKLKYKYVVPENLPDYYINGAFGGITPRNEIHVHFFSERNPIPKEAVVEFEEKDGSVKNVSEKMGGDVVRLVQASLVMDIDTATRIRNWFDDRIDNLNKQIETKNKKPKKPEKKKKGK